MASWIEVKQASGDKVWVNMDYAVKIQAAAPATGMSGKTEIVLQDGDQLFSTQSVDELSMMADRAARRA